MKSKTPQENIDVYVWEGKSDIYDRVVRCLASFEIDVIRADLLDAVNRAVEPTHASVWIKP